MNLFCSALSCLLLLWGAGCTSVDPRLVVESSARGRAATQAFTAAYLAQNTAGDTDIVIIDNAEMQVLSGEMVDAPVRHILHLRVLWKPTRDVKADHTSASNATVHWYVLGRQPGDVLEYDGTAMVVVSTDERGAELSIRSASIHPVARRGTLRDPLGTATLHGSLHAADNPVQLVNVLKQVRSAIAIADQGPDHLTLGQPADSAASVAQ